MCVCVCVCVCVCIYDTMINHYNATASATATLIAVTPPRTCFGKTASPRAYGSPHMAV